MPRAHSWRGGISRRPVPLHRGRRPPGPPRVSSPARRPCARSPRRDSERHSPRTSRNVGSRVTFGFRRSLARLVTDRTPSGVPQRENCCELPIQRPCRHDAALLAIAPEVALVDGRRFTVDAHGMWLLRSESRQMRAAASSGGSRGCIASASRTQADILGGATLTGVPFNSECGSQLASAGGPWGPPR